MKIGVLTGGGDCAGLNAAIRAVVRRALEYGDGVVGVRHGWLGLLGGGEVETLTRASVTGVLPLGGTLLGTSRTNPVGRMEEVEENLNKYGIEALVVIGGDDTLSVAFRLQERGAAMVGVPKTVDNDVSGTDYCIGFDSAVAIVVEALDRLHTTASAHHRVMVVEVMGREAGWVAVMGGLAGGADYIAIPEEPASMDELCRHLVDRW